MDYSAYLGSTRNLDFVSDEATADAVVKASLGILASRLPEREAREFTAVLPPPLEYDTLRSHQERITDVSVDTYLHDLQAQFGFSDEEARTAAATTLNVMKQNVGDARVEQLQRKLPADWAAFLDEV